LKKLGVDILWIMPIHPIGEKNRKGSLGSYYAVKDYKVVNPEFGTMDDFKMLVDSAHSMGFYVLIDWVANHTAWDHAWVTQHPGWYTKDSTGQMISPYDWSDVVDLNYENDSVWDAMTDALKFWVREADIDGYRCDVAHEVPTPFWEQARKELDAVKPVFMLAESEIAGHHNAAFDMTYAWELHSIFNGIAKGEKNATDLKAYFAKQDTTFPTSAYRMNFITNHDENSWNGTVDERMGESAGMFAVLCYTLPGMPLIYSGQEVGLDKPLKFFEKDQIDWNTDPSLPEFYTRLNRMKSDQKAFWNGDFGGDLNIVETSQPENVFAFMRVHADNAFFIAVNFTGKKQEFILQGDAFGGSYKDYFTQEKIDLKDSKSMFVSPWSYRLYQRIQSN
jgi:glycosidase